MALRNVPGDVARRTDAFGFAPLNLLVLVLLFGVVLLVESPTRWRGQVAVKGQAKVSRPLRLKTGDDCPLCQAEQTLSI